MNMKPGPDLGQEMKAFIDAEMRKATLLPPDELRAIIEPWMAPLRQTFDFVQQLQQSWIGWIEQNREPLAAFNKFVRQAALAAGEIVAATDTVSRSFAGTLARLERLAAHGWTLPTQLSVAELHDFAQLEDSDAAADFLVKKLEELDPEFSQMEERLLSDSQLKEFSTILPQCFRSIRREDYAIAIPSLMAMLERVIQRLNPPDLAANTNVVKTLTQGGTVAKKAQYDLFCTAIWFSLATVVTDLWKQYPLHMLGTPMLSRPAIQHGRIEPPNSKSEVVRLLNTLETALALHDQLDRSGLPTRTSKKTDRREHVLQAMLTATFYLPRSK